MNKLLLLGIIVLIAIAAYFALSPKPATEPEGTTVSGTLPDAEEDSMTHENAVDAMPSNLISSSPENADVFIMEPGDGTTVTSPVTVKFGITGMTVAPAGDATENSGHHHLLINMDDLPPMDLPLPATDQLIHFGAGQTETTLELEPGEYTLQLVLGNHLHIPHDPPVVSRKISITVSE